MTQNNNPTKITTTPVPRPQRTPAPTLVLVVVICLLGAVSKPSSKEVGNSSAPVVEIASVASRATGVIFDSGVVLVIGRAVPAWAASKCSRNSSAVWKRSSRSLVIDRSTTASNSGETFELKAEGGVASSETCWYATETALSPLNGGLPASNS